MLDAWLVALESAPKRWDLLRISRLLEGEELISSISSVGLAGHRRVRLRVEQPAFYLPLPPSYSEYLAARSGKFRNHLRRAAKRLEARGEVTFTRLRDPACFASAFAELLEIERGSWKHAHGTAISAIAHQRGFYEDFARGALARGRLHLTFLRINGRAVAYNLGLVLNDCYYYLKTSYIESLRSQGIATVGRAKLIEQLIADCVRTFDFPGEPYEWEQQWTTDLRWHRSLLVFNRTLLGTFLWAVITARGIFRGRKDERRVVFHDPRALRAPEA
jgi:CelD/BcsL family acetyltransferase involved in cellulose biosynthesis